MQTHDLSSLQGMAVSQLCSTEGETEAQIRLSSQCSELGRAGPLCKALTPSKEEEVREKEMAAWKRPSTISHSEEPVQPTLLCSSATLLQFPGQTIAHSLSQKGNNGGRGQ